VRHSQSSKHTSGAIAVECVFAKDKHLTVMADNGTAARVTCGRHNPLAFETNHLLGFHGFHLAATFRYSSRYIPIHQVAPLINVHRKHHQNVNSVNM